MDKSHHANGFLSLNITKIYNYWAIPEMNDTPSKEDIGFPNFVLTFAKGIPKIK